MLPLLLLPMLLLLMMVDGLLDGFLFLQHYNSRCAAAAVVVYLCWFLKKHVVRVWKFAGFLLHEHHMCLS